MHLASLPNPRDLERNLNIYILNRWVNFHKVLLYLVFLMHVRSDHLNPCLVDMNTGTGGRGLDGSAAAPAHLPRLTARSPTLAQGTEDV